MFAIKKLGFLLVNRIICIKIAKFILIIKIKLNQKSFVIGLCTVNLYRKCQWTISTQRKMATYPHVKMGLVDSMLRNRNFRVMREIYCIVICNNINTHYSQEWLFKVLLYLTGMNCDTERFNEKKNRWQINYRHKI